MKKIIKRLEAKKCVIVYKGTYTGFAGTVDYVIYYIDIENQFKDDFSNEMRFYTHFYKKGKDLSNSGYPLLEYSVKDAYYRALQEDLKRKNWRKEGEVKQKSQNESRT
jgi:hypothetical protein